MTRSGLLWFALFLGGLAVFGVMCKRVTARAAASNAETTTEMESPFASK
jgi:hypothetical protein